jgi:hypothetical protein
MYALAASAAGVGVLALSQCAEAKIVYKPLDKVIRPNHRYLIDLNHDGKPDFAIKNSFHCDIDNTCTSLVSAIRYGANGVEGTPGTEFTPPGAFALKAGAKIGPGHPFLGRKMAGGGQTTQGKWYNVTNSYLGLKFKIKGVAHYGWARLTVKLEKGFVVTLTGYAYETTPNKPIIAGKTKGSDEVMPDATVARPSHELGSLGLLALGAPGLSAWRREEWVAAAQ